MTGNEATRIQRRTQLQTMWNEGGKKGQSTVLSLCHQALPKGETLRAGMSVFDVILDDEFGTREEEVSAEPGK